MLTSTLDKQYFITYSNYFKVGNKILSFRSKELFDITNTPTKLELKDNNGSHGYWINRNWCSMTKIQELILKKEIKIDVSNLQWYQQLQLDYVFNI